MQNSNITTEMAIRTRYQQRVNSLGRCLMLWASQCSELAASQTWNYTELDADILIDLLNLMAEDASQVDQGSARLWIQLESLLSQVA